jgi:flagellar motility protein MotE (MotC chaperone)
MNTRPRMLQAIGVSVVLITVGAFLLLLGGGRPTGALFTGTANAQTSDSESNGARSASSADDSVEPSPGQGDRSEDQWAEDLRQKELLLARKEKELANKRQTLEALQKDIEKELAELNKVRRELADYTKKADAKRKKRIEQLVKSMEVASPKNAAQIFEQLEINLAVNILSQMTERKAGKIIDEMSPETMVKIITEMSRIRKPSQ